MLPAAAHLLGWVAQSSCSVLSQTFLGCMQWHRRCNDGWIRSLPDARGQRVFFLKDPLALGTPGPKKHRAPFQPSRAHHWWDTTSPAGNPSVHGPCPSVGSVPACTCPARSSPASRPLTAQPATPCPTPCLLYSPCPPARSHPTAQPTPLNPRYRAPAHPARS